jgi:hypothetical protein
MSQSAPLLTSSDTILWLKVALTAVLLGVLCLRYKNRRASSDPTRAYPLRVKTLLIFGVLFSFAVFHNLGQPRSGSFVHYGEMFHYYLGAKYFDELGYYQLYKAVIVADDEQGGGLVSLPFYTDLTSYQNAGRETALEQRAAVKRLFTKGRWNAFKRDVSFFREATATPRFPGLFFQVMDHGYNASPASAFVLGLLTKLIPVTQLWLLAALDVLLVAAMVALVFSTFGLATGAMFSIYFFVNILNDGGYISGGALRYDWLFCIVVAVCLLERGRHATAAVFLATSAMIKIFPAVLFYGIGVSIARTTMATRALDKTSARFVLAAGATALALFVLPAVSFGSVLEPWQEFSAKTTLHNDGVYVNHLGLRGIVLFEPSHLSLDKFVESYASADTVDIVRHWQDVKEAEYQQKKPTIVVCSLLVLLCLTAIVWKRKAPDSENVLWPLLLIYTVSYPSHYYYAFLCLFVLLFFRRTSSLSELVPLGLLLVLNMAALVTDSFGPSPIVFYTLVNIYLFACLASILAFELYTNVLQKAPVTTVAAPAPREASAKRRRSKKR